MLESIQDTLTVDALMTGREHLLTINRTADPTTVQEEVRELEINQVPVIDGGTVAGLMIVEPEDRTLPKNGDYEQIAPRWLVSADTSIRRLIGILDGNQHPARFVFQEDRVVGLVTYADLNDAVARTALYLLISQLEIKLARLLRHHAKDSWAYIDHLSEKRKNEFTDLKKKMADKDVTHDPIEHFNLSDVLKAVRNEPDLLEQLGYPSKSQFKKAASGINSMRNDVAHSVRMVVNDVESVASVNRRCERAEAILDRI